MSLESSILLAIYFPLGIVLLSLAAYMYDKINKESYYDKKYKNHLLDGNKMMFNLAYSAPFRFIYMSIKNKDIKGLIVGILFFIILIGAIIIGVMMIR